MHAGTSVLVPPPPRVQELQGSAQALEAQAVEVACQAAAGAAACGRSQELEAALQELARMAEQLHAR